MTHDESRHHTAEQGNDELAQEHPDESLNETRDAAAHQSGRSNVQSFGSRLRDAREQRGLKLSACAQDLHLPSRLLRKLEADDYEGIDYSVYLRGYLEKYASHVELEPELIQAQLESLKPRSPELVTTQHISPWQRLVSRYSSAATYVVLTAVIMVPLIWFGLNGGLKRDIAKLAPLDAAPVSAHSTALAGHDSATVASADKPVAKPEPKSEQPLMASMTPFSAMEQDAIQPPAATHPAATTGAGHHLTLQLQSRSWVEITDSTGKRLEYALLPAGTNKSYHSDKPLDVRIGNVEGAQIKVDGKPLALDTFQHANVAHFRLAENGSAQPSNG